MHRRVLVGVLFSILMAALPSHASAQLYDFAWEMGHGVFINPDRNPPSVTGATTATLAPWTDGTRRATILTFNVPGVSGPPGTALDGALGGFFPHRPDGTLEPGNFVYPDPAMPFGYTEGLGSISFNATGFTANAVHQAGGPDAGSWFRASATERTVAAAEPVSAALTAIALAGAAAVRRRRR